MCPFIMCKSVNSSYKRMFTFFKVHVKSAIDTKYHQPASPLNLWAIFPKIILKKFEVLIVIAKVVHTFVD